MTSLHLQVWNLISTSLQQNIPVMLLYVLDSQGSSPGRQGFVMAVNGAGEMEGSIGGGIMEHKFVELAKEKLRTGENEHAVRKQIHDKSAAKNQSGMICSGEQTIFLYRVPPTDIRHVQHIIHCLRQNLNGTLHLSPNGLQFTTDVPLHDYTFTYTSDEDWLYTEKAGYKHHVFIIGGGHCSLALSKLMKMLNFYVHVYDDRENLNTFRDNSYAHEKTIVANYSELKNIVEDGNDKYVVAMTFGYRTDDTVVRALMYKRFKYFGLLGSKHKIEQMFAAYSSEGIAPQILHRIHAPVGIHINSQTPEEIAVSIAAEIIAVKNKAGV